MTDNTNLNAIMLTREEMTVVRSALGYAHNTGLQILPHPLELANKFRVFEFTKLRQRVFEEMSKLATDGDLSTFLDTGYEGFHTRSDNKLARELSAWFERNFTKKEFDEMTLEWAWSYYCLEAGIEED